MKETVGWIGLGAMGSAMAANLLKAGFGLRVYNRTAEKARPLVEKGATLAKTTAPGANLGITSRTITPALAPIAGLKTASPASATITSGCVSPSPFGTEWIQS